MRSLVNTATLALSLIESFTIARNFFTSPTEESRSSIASSIPNLHAFVFRTDQRNNHKTSTSLLLKEAIGIPSTLASDPSMFHSSDTKVLIHGIQHRSPSLLRFIFSSQHQAFEFSNQLFTLHHSKHVNSARAHIHFSRWSQLMLSLLSQLHITCNYTHIQSNAAAAWDELIHFLDGDDCSKGKSEVDTCPSKNANEPCPHVGENESLSLSSNNREREMYYHNITLPYRFVCCRESRRR